VGCGERDGGDGESKGSVSSIARLSWGLVTEILMTSPLGCNFLNATAVVEGTMGEDQKYFEPEWKYHRQYRNLGGTILKVNLRVQSHSQYQNRIDQTSYVF